MAPLLACQNVCLGYDGREVLHGVSFQVHAGDYLCIIGENGSGKSTLMQAVLGLHKPLSGEILKGKDVSARDFGYLPQQTEIQKDFPASVREIVLSGFLGKCGWRPFYTGEEKRSAEAMLERLGIAHLRCRCYRELSGGQQQRVLLARALCATGKILFLDEPVTGLDSEATAEMYALLRQICREGTAIVMISHNIDTVLDDASHILWLGRKAWFGTRADYLQEVARHDS